jgi:hypothetical protein
MTNGSKNPAGYKQMIGRGKRFAHPLCFLDFDGAIVTRSSMVYAMTKENRDVEMLDPVCIERLNRIVEATGAKIVISSTWRILHTLEELKLWLKEKGFRGEVIGSTPVLYMERGVEIQTWLGAKGCDRSSFVIIDDDDDMAHLLHKLVRTNMDGGLLDHHVDQAIKILKEPL